MYTITKGGENLVKITADSACDLSTEIVDFMDITITPLYIIVDGGESHRDGVDITTDDLFRVVETEKKKCQTTAVNQFDYQKVFGDLHSKYDAVVHFNISAEFSACWQNATLAAKEYPNIHVVDTRNLSTGFGYVVYEAALKAQEGADADEIVAHANNIIPKIDCSFVIDRLDYLHRGGRCSGLESIGARILNIKPCIEVVEGKMRVGKKYRGSFMLSLEKYIADRLASHDDIDYTRVFITHPKCTPGVVKRVEEILKGYGKFTEIIETRAGCTVSNHCGPNTLGIIFKRI